MDASLALDTLNKPNADNLINNKRFSVRLSEIELCNRLNIKNLDKKLTTMAQLESVFGKYGKIEITKLIEAEGRAWIEFENPFDALVAYDEMNKKVCFDFE